jgi:hypothetical protein
MSCRQGRETKNGQEEVKGAVDREERQGIDRRGMQTGRKDKWTGAKKQGQWKSTNERMQTGKIGKMRRQWGGGGDRTGSGGGGGWMEQLCLIIAFHSSRWKYIFY